jgi:CheY-like chemotaxis protein
VTDLSPRVVLLVEDDADLREVMEEALRMKGFEVATAANGVEALQYLREGPLPAVILLDLMMPVMDGETFRKLQRDAPQWAEIPVCVLSADRDLARRAKEMGIDTFLSKPVNLDDVVAVVKRFL